MRPIRWTRRKPARPGFYWQRGYGDAPGLLRRVSVPTLVLAVRSVPGAPDPAGFVEERRRVARAVREIGPPVRFEWIEGIHDVPLQRPAAVARKIIDNARRS